MAFCPKKENKSWLWKATTTVAGTTRLVDVQMGNSSARTLKPLYHRVEEKYAPAFYAIDDFKTYEQVLSQDKHLVGKDPIFTAEQHNSDTRHWLASFRWRSKVVIHCPEMASLSVIAVEYIHKGGGLDKLRKLLSI